MKLSKASSYAWQGNDIGGVTAHIRPESQRQEFQFKILLPHVFISSSLSSNGVQPAIEHSITWTTQANRMLRNRKRKSRGSVLSDIS